MPGQRPPALCSGYGWSQPASYGGCKWRDGVSPAGLPGQHGHLPSCPRTESGPAFIFSFFSGLPFGPSRLFLFESFFLPFGLLPDRSATGRERAGGYPYCLGQNQGHCVPPQESLLTGCLTIPVALPCSVPQAQSLGGLDNCGSCESRGRRSGRVWSLPTAALAGFGEGTGP